MEYKDYYKILGLKNDADAKAIKTAYRKLASKYHPDMNPDAGAEEKFKEVAEAYHVLKDAERRAEFDQLLKYGNQSSSGFRAQAGSQRSHNPNADSGQFFDDDYSDFFNSIFGHRNQSFNSSGREQSGAIKGQDIEVELPLLLEETLNETQKNIEFNMPGASANSPPNKKHLKVKIPLGVTDGERIRLVGQGRASLTGGLAGDLYLHIRIVPHPLFEVSGNDLLITLPLAPWEAALGAQVTVPTLEGKVSLSIPANVSSGKKLRIKGKGLKNKKATGDLFAIIKIVMPSTFTSAGNMLWQELAASEHFDARKEWVKNDD